MNDWDCFQRFHSEGHSAWWFWLGKTVFFLFRKSFFVFSSHTKPPQPKSSSDSLNIKVYTYIYIFVHQRSSRPSRLTDLFVPKTRTTWPRSKITYFLFFSFDFMKLWPTVSFFRVKCVKMSINPSESVLKLKTAKYLMLNKTAWLCC